MDRHERYWAEYCTQQLMGKERDLVHLTSETGQRINGRRVVIVGFDSDRLHVKLVDEPERPPLRIQHRNLAEPDSGSNFADKLDTKLLPEEKAIALVTEAVRLCLQQDDPESERTDMRERVKVVQLHLARGQLQPPEELICMDPMVPTDRRNDTLRNLVQYAPSCKGDSRVDFCRFAAGLVGDFSICAICLDNLDPQQRALRLPCGNLFHMSCVAPWFNAHSTCPTCRSQRPMPGSEYVAHFSDDHLLRRTQEWILNGMCEMCQAAYQEQDPLKVVRHPDGRSVLVPASLLYQ